MFDLEKGVISALGRKRTLLVRLIPGICELHTTPRVGGVFVFGATDSLRDVPCGTGHCLT